MPLISLLGGILSPAAAQVLIQPFAQELSVHDLEQDGPLWLAADEGLFSYVEGVGLERVGPEEERELYCIEKVGDELWVGGEGGVFSVANNTLVRVPVVDESPEGLDVYSIVYERASAGVWLQTNRGVYVRPQPGSRFQQSPRIQSAATFLDVVDGEVWASSFEDSFRYRRGSFEPLGDQPLPRIVEVAETAEGIYLRTLSGRAWQPGSLYRYPDHLDTPIVEGVLDIASIDNQLWFSVAGQVLSRSSADSTVRFETGEDIQFIGKTNDYLWLVSQSAVYRHRRDDPASGFQLLARKYSAFSLIGAGELSGIAWLWGRSGALRLYDDVDIQVSLNLVEDNIFGIFRDLAVGDDCKVEDVYYRKGGAVWESPGQQEFEVILSSSAKEMEEAKEELRYTDPELAVYKPDSSFSEVHVAVRDYYGNIQDPKAYDSVLFVGQTKVLRKSLRLALITTGVLAFFLVSFRMLPALPAKLALSLYFAVVNYLPLLKRLAAPSFRWSRVLLRRIYASRSCPREEARSPHDQREKFFGGLMKDPSRLIEISEKDRAEGLTLASLENEVLCRKDRIFREVFPLSLPLHFGSQQSKQDIERDVLKLIAKKLPGATKDFCQELLTCGRFLFLFTVQSSKSDLMGEIQAFHHIEGAGGWVVWEEAEALTAEEIIRRLELKPLPGEGGYYRETYRSELALPADILPSSYTEDRIASTAIYYLITPQSYSALHLLPGDEVFHFYFGDPVEMLQLYPDGKGQIVRIGGDLSQGLLPQIVVPGGCWQGSRLAPGGRFALLGTTMAPGFETRDYKSADRDELVAKYPDFAKLISELTAGPVAG